MDGKGYYGIIKYVMVKVVHPCSLAPLIILPIQNKEVKDIFKFFSANLFQLHARNSTRPE